MHEDCYAEIDKLVEKAVEQSKSPTFTPYHKTMVDGLITLYAVTAFRLNRALDEIRARAREGANA